MLPTVFDLGFARVNGYGLMIGIGVLLGYLLVFFECRRRGLDAFAQKLSFFCMLLGVTAFLGGKLFFALMYPEAFKGDIETYGVLGSMGRGFVFYGSLLVTLPVAVWRLKTWGIPVWKAFDVIMFGLPVLHGFGRLGCFMAGCCYGCRSDGPLAVTFTQSLGLNGVSLHPVQLYEAAGEFLIFAFLWFFLRRRQRFDGQIVLSYLALYAALRFGAEFLRGDGNPLFLGAGGGTHLPGDPPAGLTTPQATSLFIFLPSATLLWRGLRRHPRKQNRP